MTRSARVFGGVGLGQAHLVLATLVGLWLTPVLLARVGAEQYGLWLVGLQLLGYLYLLDLGVVGLLPRETAYASGRVLTGEPPALLAATVSRIRGVIWWQVPAVVVVTVTAWALLPASWEPLRTPLTWVLLFFAAAFPTRAYHALLQGLQDLVFLGQLQLAAWGTGTAVLVALVFSGIGLPALAAGWLVTQGITVAACWWRIRRYGRRARRRSAGPTPARSSHGRSGSAWPRSRRRSWPGPTCFSWRHCSDPPRRFLMPAPRNWSRCSRIIPRC
jgi:hypothetical protein